MSPSLPPPRPCRPVQLRRTCHSPSSRPASRTATRRRVEFHRTAQSNHVMKWTSNQPAARPPPPPPPPRRHLSAVMPGAGTSLFLSTRSTTCPALSAQHPTPLSPPECTRPSVLRTCPPCPAGSHVPRASATPRELQAGPFSVEPCDQATATRTPALNPPTGSRSLSFARTHPCWSHPARPLLPPSAVSKKALAHERPLWRPSRRLSAPSSLLRAPQPPPLPWLHPRQSPPFPSRSVVQQAAEGGDQLLEVALHAAVTCQHGHVGRDGLHVVQRPAGEGPRGGHGSMGRLALNTDIVCTW